MGLHLHKEMNTVLLLAVLQKIIFWHYAKPVIKPGEQFHMFIVCMENRTLLILKTHVSGLRTALSNGMLCSIKEQHSVLCSRDRLWDCLFLTN